MELMLLSCGMWVLSCRWGFVFVNKFKKHPENVSEQRTGRVVTAMWWHRRLWVTRD